MNRCRNCETLNEGETICKVCGYDMTTPVFISPVIPPVAEEQTITDGRKKPNIPLICVVAFLATVAILLLITVITN